MKISRLDRRQTIRLLLLIGIVAFLGLALRHTVFWSPRPVPVPSQSAVAVIAHRGASGSAPENTLAAFRRAVEDGADSVELDVELSADGELVVIHDDTVDRTTNGTGAVREMTLAQLRALDAGSWYGPAFAGERIPTLQEVMDLAAETGIWLDIEIKNEGYSPTGAESKVVELIEENGLMDRVTVSSFNPISLLRVRMANRNIPIAMLYKEDLANYLRDRWTAPLLHPEDLRPRRTMADSDHIRMLKNRGHRVVVWTVNEPGDMTTFCNLRVDGIVTDYPALLRSIVDSADCSQ